MGRLRLGFDSAGVPTMADVATTPNELLVLLDVSRTAKFTTAARNLGLTHSTVSRLIAVLEKCLGGRVLTRVALEGRAGGRI